MKEDEFKFVIPGSIVYCIDDSNKPDNVGDWPENGKQYFVEQIDMNLMDSNLCLKLKNMKTNDPFKGYNSKRFSLIVGMFSNN